VEKIFEKWCEKLLDLGKGNRLINFKPTLSKTVEILAPYTSTFFNKIKANEKLSFYDVDEYVNQITKVEEDDFDEFRAKHSSYTSYMKDDALIDEIQSLSPDMKAVVFSNLFKRIDHD